MYAFRLAFRNVISRKSSIVIIIFISFALALLALSNAIFDGTDSGVEDTYINSFTGDIVIRPKAEFPLSLFGDETPVTGTLSQVPSVIPYTQVRDLIQNTDGIESITPQVSGVAALNVNNKKFASALFGVDAETYTKMMPSIIIEEGEPFSSGNKGMMLNSVTAQSIKDSTGEELHPGNTIQLIISNGSSFTIRSAPVTAIFSYKVHNDILDNISIVDADTVRGLMGMASIMEDDSSIDENSMDLLEDFDLDSLFGDSSDFWGEEADFDMLLEEEFGADSIQDDYLEETPVQSTSWNFIVCKTDSKANPARIIRQLNREFKKQGWDVQAVNWRTAAGGAVYLVNHLRTMLNIGIILILLTGFIVVNNTLVVSSLSRIQETGTLRAIGAKRKFIGTEFFFEIILLTIPAGLLACLLGWGLTDLLNSLKITFSNKYLIQLFGGTVFHPLFNFSNALRTMGISVLLAILGWFYPVRVALSTSPVVAMRGQS